MNIIYEAQDWSLVEKQPTIPAYTPQEIFSKEQIEQNLSQATVSLQQAQDNYDLWNKRDIKANELWIE